MISVAVLTVGGLTALGFIYRLEILGAWHLSRMESEEGEGRREAAVALLALNPSRAVPRLLQWSSEELETIMEGYPDRFQPPAEVSWMLECGSGVVPPLIAVLRNPRRSRGLRRAAMHTLSIVGEPAVSSLIELLEHEDPQVRVYTVGALFHMFFLRQYLFEERDSSLPPIDEATTEMVGGALVRRLTDENEDIRWFCLGNLGVVRDWIPRLLPAFFERLQDPTRRCREKARASIDWALHRVEMSAAIRKRLRERAKTFAPILEEIRQHEDVQVRALVERALRLLGPEDPGDFEF